MAGGLLRRGDKVRITWYDGGPAWDGVVERDQTCEREVALRIPGLTNSSRRTVYVMSASRVELVAPNPQLDLGIGA